MSQENQQIVSPAETMTKQKEEDQYGSFTSLSASSAAIPVQNSAKMDDIFFDGFYKTHKTLTLGFIIFFWYFFSSLSNNINKSLLKDFPYPLSLTVSQFVFNFLYSFVFAYASRATSIDSTQTRLVLPLTLGHIFAHFLTHVSLANISVSFTHTIKATSPIFSVILSVIFLREVVTPAVILSLLPIIFGVSISSLSELQFDMKGFVTAIVSTIIFSAQNIYSKKLFKDRMIGHHTLLMYTSLFAFLLLLPFWLFTELDVFIKIVLLEKRYLITKLILNGTFHFLQVWLAFSAIKHISPITYSIANTLKRIFVIISSLIYFGNPISPLNGIGILLATGGILAYNKAKHDAKTRKDSNSKEREGPVLMV